MKVGQKLWTREELILAINLYCKLPFGRLHKSNPDIINLSLLLGRTPSSIAYKLVNFASLDPSLKARGIKGASHASNLDKEIWTEFFNNLDELAYESEVLLAKRKNSTIENSTQINDWEYPTEGFTKERLVRTRVNQAFFRSTVLAAYNNTCCITGLKRPEFLIAGHIKPWSLDENNRLNPRNGIAINALHDRAFEEGYLTITTDYKIKLSPQLFANSNSGPVEEYFYKYDNREIILPSRFLPDIEFIDYHNKNRFKS